MATMASKKSLNPTLQQSSAMQRLGELGEWLGDGERVLMSLATGSTLTLTWAPNQLLFASFGHL